MGKCHELYPCLKQVQHSFIEYKNYIYMFKSLSQFNYLRMPLVEQELLILPQKMSSPKVLMGVHIARSLVSWEGGGKSSLSYQSASWTDISRANGILKGPVVQKFYWPYGPVNFFSQFNPCISLYNGFLFQPTLFIPPQRFPVHSTFI